MVGSTNFASPGEIPAEATDRGCHLDVLLHVSLAALVHPRTARLLDLGPQAVDFVLQFVTPTLDVGHCGYQGLDVADPSLLANP